MPREINHEKESDRMMHVVAMWIMAERESIDSGEPLSGAVLQKYLRRLEYLITGSDYYNPDLAYRGVNGN
jgi:hypothetical protein